jgi:Fis family transcriptional regulator, factor for inversion stimulation protein
VAAALDRYFSDLNGTRPGDLYAMVMQEVEGPLLERVMEFTGWNQSRAAEILGMNRSTLRKKLRGHGLSE